MISIITAFALFMVGMFCGYLLGKPDNAGYFNYLNSDEWRAKRLQVLKRDGHRCQARGCTATTNLQVHHLTYDNLYDEPLTDLVTMCHKHHVALEKKVKAARKRVR